MKARQGRGAGFAVGAFPPVWPRHLQPERCDLYGVAEGAEAPKFDRGRCARQRADGLANLSSQAPVKGFPAFLMRRRCGAHRLQWRSRTTQGEITMTDSKKPTHRAFVVKKFTDKDGNEKSRWLDIGTVWTHRDGKGFDVSLEALPDRRTDRHPDRRAEAETGDRLTAKARRIIRRASSNQPLSRKAYIMIKRENPYPKRDGFGLRYLRAKTALERFGRDRWRGPSVEALTTVARCMTAMRWFGRSCTTPFAKRCSAIHFLPKVSAASARVCGPLGYESTNAQAMASRRLCRSDLAEPRRIIRRG